MHPATPDTLQDNKPTVHLIDKALQQALAQGPAAIDQQIRCVLAHSQMLALRPSTEVYREKPLSAAHARRLLLVEMAAHDSAQHDPDARETLYADLAQLTDAALRLTLQARLAQAFSPERQGALLREALPHLASTSIVNAGQRARLLLSLARLRIPQQDAASRSGIVTEMMRLARAIENPEGRMRSLIALALHAPPFATQQVYKRALGELAKTRSDLLRGSTISALAARIPVELEADITAAALAIRAPVARAQALTALARALPARSELIGLSLNAIMAIADEEERLDALVSIIPCLSRHDGQPEYSDTLTQALALAVGFTRRLLRARALVTLAPYLTPDLQREALASVHALPSERERALLLSELAPHLPADILIASLAIVHTMREQDARVSSLSVLARYLPDDEGSNARSQTMLDVLAAASNLTHPFERVRALVGLVDILPAHLRDQAYTNAVEAVRLIENEHARARALSLLGQHLPHALLPRILDTAYSLRDPHQRISALASIAARLDVTERTTPVTHLLETVDTLQFAYQRARALTSIVPCLTPDLLPRLVEQARAIHEPHDQASVLLAVAAAQPDDTRAPLVADAWALIAQIEDGYDAASALVSIAPLLPEAARPELEQRMGMVVGGIMDDYDQASAISLLAPLLTDVAPPREAEALPTPEILLTQAIHSALALPQHPARAALLADAVQCWQTLETARQYEVWREVVQRLKALPLADVLLCLSAFIPVISAFAGAHSLPKIAEVLGIQRAKTPEE